MMYKWFYYFTTSEKFFKIESGKAKQSVFIYAENYAFLYA